MAENTQPKDYFKINTENVKNVWGMSKLEFAQWLKTSKSTINGYLKNEYKWKKWDDLRIKIFILINGESVSTSDAFRNKIVELGTENLKMTAEGLETEKKSIEKNFELYYKNKVVEKCAIEVMTLIEETYEELENGKLTKSDEQKIEIKKWLEEKFSTVSQKYGIVLDDANNVESNVSSIDSSEKSFMENSANKESNADMKSEDLNDNVSSEPDTKNVDKEEIENKKSEDQKKLRKKAKKKYKRAKEIKKITRLKKSEDLQRYIKNLEFAANVGYKKAIYELGIAYKYDTGVEADFPKAVECFFQAGKLKMEDALYEVADCYRNGIGLEKSEIKAACLIDILRSRNYSPKSVVDISLNSDGYIENEEEIEEFYENFSPNTEEERKLQELIEIWKNK